MRERKFRSLFTAVAGLACASLFSGCTILYPYTISGVVKDARDGKPVAGARVFLTADGSVPAGEPQAVTGPDGKFSFGRKISKKQRPTWVLVMAKDGYRAEAIDVSPENEPESTKVPFQIAVVVNLAVLDPAKAGAADGGR